MNWNQNLLVGLISVLASAGCTSDKSVRERGWLGGSFKDVVPLAAWVPGAMVDVRSVEGLPSEVSQAGGALMVSDTPRTPAVEAGLRAGDLVLAVNGTPVQSTDALRDAVAALAPGSSAAITYWRRGEAATAIAVIGREQLVRERMFQVGLPISPVIDLWPFDDGIDVLGLIRIGAHGTSVDLASPESKYLQAVFPGDPNEGLRGRGWGVFVLLAGYESHERVQLQTSVTSVDRAVAPQPRPDAQPGP